MGSKAPVITDEEERDEARRGKSAIAFPYDDLDSAINIAKGLFNAAGTGEAEFEQIAGALNVSIKSSGFRLRVNAAKMFGLISQTPDGKKYLLTKLGQRVVDDSEAGNAKVEAFLNIPLFEKLYEALKGIPLPGREGLENQIVGLGVPEKQKERIRQIFHRSAQQGGFFSSNPNRLVKPNAGKSGNNIGAKAPPPANVSDDLPADEERQDKKKYHPFIEGLLETLPPPKTDWSGAERVKWLKAAAFNFGLIYKGDVEITIKESHGASKADEE